MLFILGLTFLSLVVVGSADIRLQYILDEEVPPGYEVGNLKLDSGALRNYTAEISDRMRFGLLSVEYRTLFEVDDVTGIVSLKARLDREALCTQTTRDCVLSMEAAIVQPTEQFTVLHLDITVRDINDNTPKFGETDYSLTVSESSPVNSTFMLPMATDPDRPPSDVQSYHLNGEHPLFSLAVGDGASGLSLVLEGVLDRETEAEYSVELVAVDGGTPTRSATLTVHIQVADSNDNSPVFDRDTYDFTIPEDYEPGKSIIQVKATDLDQGRNAQILYSLSPQTLDQYEDIFAIENETGVIYLKDNLDYQMGTSHQLIVIARDLGITSRQDHCNVIIYVQDVNNHRPEITVYPVTSDEPVGVKENTPPGEIIALVTAKDLDPGDNGICVCRSLDTSFRLEQMYENGFKLIANERFDRERQQRHLVTILCQDSGTPPLSSEHQVSLVIYDENDNDPVFSQSEYTVSIREDASVGESVIQVSAADPDEGDAARITYGLDQAANNQLAIDPVSGVIAISAAFDHEKSEVQEYRLLAEDHGTPPRTAHALLRIRIADVNDESPVFIQNAYNFGTYENQANNTEIGTVTAVDRDSHPYNVFVYSLYGPQNVLDIFAIDPVSGRIASRISLDRERQDVYEMIVVATDVEAPQPSSSVSVTIHVADKNDNRPIITVPDQINQSVQLSVYAPLDFVFFRVIAHDKDLGKNAKLQYSLATDYGAFFIDTMQGYLLVKSNLHNIRQTVVVLDIRVSDEGSPRLSTNATLQVVINRTVDFAREQALFTDQASNSFGLELSKHEQILVVLGAVTSLIVTFLIIAIVFVKRRQTNGQTKQSLEPAHRVTSQPRAEKVKGQRVSIQRQHSESKDNELNNHKSAVEDIRQVVMNRITAIKKNQSECELETTSRHSGELSNPDSGRGQSEEGDCVESSNMNRMTPTLSVSRGTETGPNHDGRHRSNLYARQIAQQAGRHKSNVTCQSDWYSQEQTIKQELPLLSRLIEPQNVTDLNGLVSSLIKRRLGSVSSGGSQCYGAEVLSRTSSRGGHSVTSRNSSRAGSELGNRTVSGQPAPSWSGNMTWTTSEASLDDLSSASSGSFIINMD